MFRVDSSVAAGNGAAIAARTREVYAPLDRARMKEIDRLIAKGHGSESPGPDDDEAKAAIATIPPPARAGRLPGQVTCAVPSCGKDLGERDKTGLCKRHRRAVVDEPHHVQRTHPQPPLDVGGPTKRPLAEEERHADAGGKAAQPPQPGPTAALTCAPPAPASDKHSVQVATLSQPDKSDVRPVRGEAAPAGSAPSPADLNRPRTTTALIGELVARLDRDVNGIMPDGLPSGRQGSTARLMVPRLTPATSSVMTDRTCRCGCTRHLRKNNSSGYSGYCNEERYAAGHRPPRKSRAHAANEETRTMKKREPCDECGSTGRHKKICSKSSANGKAAATTPPPHIPVRGCL